MSLDVRVEFRGKRWRNVAEDTLRLLDAAVRKAAFDVEAGAKLRAPVDTGALKASIHAVTDQGSHYAAASGAARALNPKAEVYPETRPEGKHSAVVAVGVSYGAAVEFGRHGQSAQPYMTPAAEAVRPKFVQACEEALEKGAR